MAELSHTAPDHDRTCSMTPEHRDSDPHSSGSGEEVIHSFSNTLEFFPVRGIHELLSPSLCNLRFFEYIFRREIN